MKNKKESGELVVEASIVVTLVMIVITIMLYVGMILYQQTLVSVMANQTASNIAQVYSNNLKDPFTGYVDPDGVYQSITYSNMKTDAYMDVIEQKANVFSRYRLKSSRILATGNTSVEVEIVKKPNELLKSQIVVTIRDKYDMPLVGIFGTSGLAEFGSIGRADCVDILEYINGVEAIGNPEESNVSFLPDSNNCTITFIPNRNNPSDSTVVTVLKGKSILTSNKYTHCVMPGNSTNGSFEFAGWFDESGSSFTASTTVNNNVVVYGSWKCTITLDADGGKVQSKNTHSFKITIGTRVAIPNASRSGYIFNGWFTEKGGKGTKYLSNDSIITGDVTLYAYWTCAHPGRYESSRTGSICEGGTIYYKCTQCQADMGTGWYAGNGHSYCWKCDKAHRCYSWFDGTPYGGCGGYHVPGKWCGSCGITHNKVYGYCVICEYCYRTSGSMWCGNKHCGYNISGRPYHTPSTDHVSKN